MGLNLYPHQSEMVGAVDAALANPDVHSCILQSATGSGKTVMAMKILKTVLAAGGSAVFIASRRELIYQPVDKLETMADMEYGRDFAIIMAGEEPWPAPLQIISKDTLFAKMRRNPDLNLPQADVVIVDEAHLSLAPTWMKILSIYKARGAKIIGLTATPARGDGRGLIELYDEIVLGPTIQWLIDNKFLVPGVFYGPSEPDLAGITIRNGDYAPGELSLRLNNATIIGDIVAHWMKFAAKRKRTLVFCAGVKHALHVRDVFVEHGFKAAAISGETPTKERDDLMDQYRSGEISIMCNCDVLTYGIDVPEIDCLILARPTKSIVLHFQMLGRGMRTSEGKADYLVLDHAGNINRNGFPTDEMPWSLGDERLQDVIAASKTKESTPTTCGNCSRLYTGARACPSCGWEPPLPKGKDINVNEGELQSLVNGQAKIEKDLFFGLGHAQLYLQFLGYTQMAGKNAGMAYHLYLERTGEKPEWSWKQFATQEPCPAVLGYIKHKQIAYAKRMEKKNARN